MLQALWRGAVILVVLGGTSTSAHAADNILGLPTPRDTTRPGAIMLHGGGPVSNEVFQRFIDLAGGKQARIVLVPSAGYRPADYDSRQAFRSALNRRFASWVYQGTSGHIKSFDFLYTDDPEDADDSSFVRPLTSATGVWFCGGDQARLNHRFVGDYPKKSRFQVALREVLARGGVVGGTSAGMAALPEIMTLDQDRRNSGGPLSVTAAHGLGLFDGAIVEQHFDERLGRLERFTGLLRDSSRLDRLAERRGVGANMLGLAVEASTALVVQTNRLEALGTGEAHVFIKSPSDKSLTWHAVKSGDKAALNRDGRGQISFVSERPLIPAKPLTMSKE